MQNAWALGRSGRGSDCRPTAKKDRKRVMSKKMKGDGGTSRYRCSVKNAALGAIPPSKSLLNNDVSRFLFLRGFRDF